MTSGQPPYHDVKANLRAIRILFGSIVAGALFFGLIVLGLHATGAIDPAIIGKNEIIRLVIGGVAAVCILIAQTNYRKSRETVKNLTGSLNDKLNVYRLGLIRYLALCDFAALLSIIGFFLTGDYVLLIIAGCILVVMLFVFPTRNRLINELALDWNEQAQL